MAIREAGVGLAWGRRGAGMVLTRGAGMVLTRGAGVVLTRGADAVLFQVGATAAHLLCCMS